jgi:hypothetical protein
VNEAAFPAVTGQTVSQAACGQAAATSSARAHAVSEGAASWRHPPRLMLETPPYEMSAPHELSVDFELMQALQVACDVWNAMHADWDMVDRLMHAAS